MPRGARELSARFFEKTKKLKSCWRWCGLTNPGGYGVIAVRGVDGRWANKQAHRVSWELANGPLPKEAPGRRGARGNVVMHTCDNRWCVNPAHLRLGTQAENLADMRLKGRGACGERHSQRMKQVAARGENNGRAKLTQDQAMEVLQRARAGEDQKSIAQDFCIRQTTVSRILRGLRWPELQKRERG